MGFGMNKAKAAPQMPGHMQNAANPFAQYGMQQDAQRLLDQQYAGSANCYAPAANPVLLLLK
jgi:hypothetical protein